MNSKRLLIAAFCIAIFLFCALPGEARLSRALTDLGFDREIRVEGAASVFSAYFPLPRMERISGEMLWRIALSPVLRGDGIFSFSVNERPVLTKSVEELRKSPEVRVPIPEGLPWEPFLHARVEARVAITDDLCRDIFSGGLFWSVQGSSGLLFDDLRKQNRSVSDFFETLFGELRIVVSPRPTLDEGRAAVWLSSLMKKAFPGLSVSIVSDFGEETRSMPFVLIAGRSTVLPEGIEARNGLSLLGERGLLLFDDTMVDGLSGMVRDIASYPLFAAIPSGAFLPERSAAEEQPASSNLLPLTEGTGNNIVFLDVPVFPGLLKSPPQDLSFQLDGVFTLPNDRSRPARLDIFWNGVLMESEHLPESGRFGRRFVLPAETPLATENRLRLDIAYFVDEGMCRYRSPDNRATLLPSSAFHGYGKYPLDRLSWDSFGIFALRKGLLLLDDDLSPDLLAAAADMLYWLSSRYPQGVFLFPEVGTTLVDSTRVKDAEWLMIFAGPGTIPRDLQGLLPVNVHDGLLLHDRRDGRVLYSYERDEEVALLLLGSETKPVVLLTSSSASTMSSAAAFFASPKNAAQLRGNMVAFRFPEDVRTFDTRSPLVSVERGALLSFAERAWIRYRGFFILGAWVLITVLFAGIFLKKRRGKA